MAVIDDGPEIQPRQLVRARLRASYRPGRSQPRRANSAAAPSVVEADGHPTRVLRGEGLDELGRVVERGGAEHDPLHAGVEQFGDVVGGAPDPPARLHGDVDGAGDGQDHVAVHRLARAGRVEVHDMDPAGPTRY